MVHCNKKTRRSSGFTMVELMVVLAIMAILAALVGGGLIAYTRLARFEKNEANARTLFQTAQIALTRRDTAGELDDFRQKVLLNGQAGAHFDPAALTLTGEENEEIRKQKADELNKNIYALYYDKVTDDDSDNELLRELLGDYIYDDSLLNAAVCVEIDAASGQVYSVFYDTNADKLRFGKTDGATDIYDRSYDHRRHDSLVGYYSAEDRVNVVELQQTKLKVKNPRLSNTETLTLSWGGDVTRDTQVQYVATAYKSTDTDKKNPLFEIEVELPAVKTNEPVPLKTTIYSYDAAGNETPVEKTLYYPLSYNKGNFVLTLDAMASADLLRSCENDSGETANSISVTDSSLYSITRLLSGGPQDFYVTLQAKARDGYSGSYTPSTPADTNVENSLFAKEATATKGNLTYFRHLYNLRWADNWASGQTAAYTLAAQSLGATGLNWTGGSVTVYCPAQGKNFPPEAKVPSAEEAVAWPTILTLPKNVTLDGGNITIMNLQLRGSSVSRTGRQKNENLLDRYIGLVGENNGTIKNMTLRDADVQVNVEIVTRAKGTLPLTGTTALQPLETTDSAYRDIRAVGALCGVNTGTLESCTLTHGKNNAVSAQVLAMLPFDDNATAMARTTVSGTAYYENEPRGIGGLVGVAIPKNGQTQTISTLTVDANVTVAGLLQDNSPKAADKTLTEQARYAAAASGENSIWRSIGVGGVVGTMDAAKLNLAADASGKTITNKAAVIGSAFTGGVVGNLYNSSSADVTLTGLQNEGTVSVGANYLGSAEGENSRVLGQFFGGIAGYCKDVTLSGSTSTTRRDMTETQLKTAVKGGYANDGALTDDSPLKGDFVGGLVGFASGCKLENCTTQKGYVLGRCFVGGIAGGFSGSQLKITGGSNSSTVLGNRYVGGVVSVNGSQSTVSGVTNSGLVAGLGKNAAYVGGIAGLNDAEWGSTDAANTAATIQNCVSSMASDTATNSSRSALLQALSTYKNVSNQETTTRADYVGGLVGRNGKNAVLTWDDKASTVQIGAVISGSDFVGGLVGCNDATAKITNTSASLLTVSGEIVGGKAVGGMIGLNLAPALPAADIKVTEISGTLCVGGVIGANMPVAAAGGDAFTITSATSGSTAGRFTTTAKAGRIKADGLAGGIIGYNCLLASAPNDLTTILPTVARDTGLVTVNNTLPRDTANTMTLSGAANQFNLEVNAYVGGIVGYNDAATHLTISSATNGSDSNAASVGSLKMRGETGTLGSGVSLQGYNPSFNYNDYVSGNNARGSMAGGIIGCVTPKTKLEGCTNYGIVSHKSAAGGIAGWNDGSINNCRTYATLGTQQDGYAYLGGIVGINNGTVINSAPAESITVRGRYIIGGVAGLNLTGASITYNTSDSIPVTVQANKCAGGVAGVNCGSIALGGTTLQVSITAESYAGGIAGSNNTRNTTIASIAGGNVTGTVTATKDYAGGAAGANYAEIDGVKLIYGACVRANDWFAGGIAGSNMSGNGQNGTITGCTNNAGQNGNNYTVYATNGNAGGIAGSNGSGAKIVDSVVDGGVDNGIKIGVAKCDAAGIAANNFGIIQGGTVGSCDITFAGESIGAVTAINNAGATISGVTLDMDANIAFHGPATNVGGIAGKNAGTIDKCTVSSPALNLGSLTARADSISLGGAAGVNMQDATISETNVTLNITDNLNKYKNLGGVAGENAGGGTLLKCTYQGALGQANTTGAANVLDTVGGIVGLNNGEVNGCSVPKITLQVMGASGLSDSQTYAEKLKSASSVGGIAGRNNSTITSCYVATGEGGGSIITARYGFVGGVAGANNGSISSSGSGAEGVTNLVKQVGDWFTADSTNDTNDMITTLKGDTYNSLKGVDTVFPNNYNTVYTTTGLSQNDLLVGLRGTTATNGKSSGYLGGVAGFNTVNGTITGAATGKWFVYGDNTTEESKIGGMIGMNEATGEVKLLVNCAAVRRFTRTDGTNDDNTTYRGNTNIAYVGGVIGVQQNTTNDKWVISECVNLGTVFDSGSNYIGGIIASWLKNGGTIEKSFNFGSLSTNTNYGGGSGTVGGIVGFFDQPTPGGTANILSCQNHGDILSSGNWPGDNNKKHGANDVAGILGKVVMADGTNDYLRINIVDCVNGEVKMQCESLAAGIMGWLGPFGDGGTKIPNKVEVYIDRCRNYATDVTISLKSGDINLFAGICGNRGNGSATSASTTVTNCFALYKNTVSSKNAPIAMNRGSENIVAYGNYFMDENSFEEKKIAALLKLTEGTPSGEVTANEGRTYGTSCKNHYNYGTRLYAGIDNSIESGNRFFAAGMMTNTRDLNTVDTTKCYIIPAANEKLATIYYTGNPGASDINNKDLATILLWYGEKDKVEGPSMKDITDDLIQNYYTQVLDKRGPGTVSGLQVAHKKDSSAVYGRYEVTWSAAVTDGIFPDNQIQNVSHYLVTLYKVDGANTVALENYKDIKVYGTRYLFDADDALANAIGTGQFCVGVKAVNGIAAGEEVKSTAQYFVRPLPTPKLEIRLKKQPSNGQAYGQYLVLTNASDYQNAGNWQVTAYLMNQPNTEITLSADNTEAPIANGLGSATRLRATATPGEGATGAWMESARYDEEIGIPKTYYSTGDKGSNSGLVHGTAFETNKPTMGQPVITGSTADDLSITVNLQFTADTIFNTVPNYRVMLVGQYTGNEQISNAAEDTTATNSQPLKGQYVTLAAVEKPVYSSGTEFVLSNLPAVVFDGSYTDLKVISVPIDAGYPQVVTRWEITADDALNAIGEGNINPVSWNSGIEIVRGADGKFSYYHLTPLQFFATGDQWYNMAEKQIRKDDLNLKLLKAPKVSNTATGVVSTDNKLNYTFTWTQYNADGTTPDTTEHDYDVTLYGLLTQKTGETTAIASKEKIELKDGVSLADKTTFDAGTGTYTLTLCVDDDLASGSWRYDTVRLHVTRKPDTGDTNAIGLAGEADCTVKQRLSAVGQVNSIMRTNDNSANALNYDITWPASADAKGENTVTYTLYAEKLDGNNWTALANWKGITKNSCTVDLEKYQGETLRFYVVANAVDKSKYCSPNGEYSNLLVVEKRLAAPVVTTAALSYQTPSQTQFLTKEKLTLTVKDASGGSYYYMGYLFKNAADYKQIAELANSYQHAQTPDAKAASLANLTNALNEMLTDTTNPGRVLRLLPEGRMDGGAQAETTTGGAAFALGDESFTMKPEYAGYWLLPALRSMSTDGTTASSNWYYYVADALGATPTEMQLPKIKLDAPAAVIGNVEREETVGLYDNPEYNGVALETTTLQLSRRTVEWPLSNLYDDKDAGTVRSLTNVYQFTVTPVSASEVPYTVKVWVNDREYTDDDGKLHPIGEIVKVEKTVTLTDGDDKQQTLTQKIEPTVDEAAQRVWYDLSLLPTVEKSEGETWQWSEWKRQTTRITGTKVENTTKAYYAADVYPMLEVVKNSANEVMLRVTLPDLFKVYMDTQDTLQKISATLTVRALPYEDTDGNTDGKTAESEPSAVELNEADTASQTAAEAPYSDDSEAEDTVPVQAWRSPARAVTELHPTNQTPETAADAETIQPPAA